MDKELQRSIRKVHIARNQSENINSGWVLLQVFVYFFFAIKIEIQSTQEWRATKRHEFSKTRREKKTENIQEKSFRKYLTIKGVLSILDINYLDHWLEESIPEAENSTENLALRRKRLLTQTSV